MTESKRLRILVVWGASHFDEMLQDDFLDSPDHDI